MNVPGVAHFNPSPAAFGPAVDFAQRQQRNQRASAALVLGFILFFLLIGLIADHVYLDVFTPGGAPLPFATLGALTFATVMTLTAYRAGGKLILASMGA